MRCRSKPGLLDHRCRVEPMVGQVSEVATCSVATGYASDRLLAETYSSIYSQRLCPSYSTPLTSQLSLNFQGDLQQRQKQRDTITVQGRRGNRLQAFSLSTLGPTALASLLVSGCSNSSPGRKLIRKAIEVSCRLHSYCLTWCDSERGGKLASRNSCCLQVMRHGCETPNFQLLSFCISYPPLVLTLNPSQSSNKGLRDFHLLAKSRLG